MTSPISIPVSFPGVDQSQSSMAALANAVAQLSGNVGALGNSQRQQAQDQAGATAATQSAATQAIAFGQRLAGVANAVQNLTSRLGSHNTTAGLVGSIASTTTQFASMGAALGPQGAVIGGIVGLGLAVHDLAEQQTTAAERTQALTDANAQLGHQAQETTRQLAAELVADETLYREHAAAVTSFWNTVTGNTARALSRLRDDRAQIEHDTRAAREAYEAGDQGADGLGGLHYGSGGGFGARPTDDDVTRLTGRGATGPAARHGGGGGGDPVAAAAAAARERQQEAERIAAEQLAVITEHQTKLVQEQELAEQALAATKAQAAEDATKATLRESEARERYYTQLAHYQEQERRWAAETAHQREAQTQEASSAASAVIGNLTNVFTLMAEGQASAAQGAELLLAGFLQYISQRATIEALAQVAQGIGSYPDFGGMALHFAAAAAWGAVAVATGVGGAALASDAQSKGAAAESKAQQSPASPQSSDTQATKGNSTVVINWNAPVVTGQTEAQLGRTMRRMVDRATTRWANG